MLLGLHEIRARAADFAREWEGVTEERAEAQSFWNDFFNVFGVRRRKVGIFFEKAVERIGRNAHGRIDVFWPGQLIAEHKSAGRSLDDAYVQATDYLLSATIKEAEQPRYVIVSDFKKIRLYDLETSSEKYDEFELAELPSKIKKLGFIAGRHEVVFKDEDPINVKAVKNVGKLHESLIELGFKGHDLEVLLVRLVFCFFADDTRIFENDTFRLFLTNQTKEDGTDLGGQLSLLFQILNTPKETRQANLDDDLKELPYIDGHLFEEKINIPIFTAKTRELLLACTSFDWSKISPAIFGSMFQSVMDEDQRHDLGAHYTSEKNILKLIGPLFLDELKAELAEAGKNKKKLESLHEKISKLNFLDPACGCGNFLVVSYRELRRLEMEILKRLYVRDDNSTQTTMLNMGALSGIDVDCMYGIEIEEFPARIAELALWLTDHQMNTELGDMFGVYYARLPLTKKPNIHHANALTTDWESVVPKVKLSYILGNPPFLGYKQQDANQKADLDTVRVGIKGAGVIDFVGGWYIKAAKYIQDSLIVCAFVSTNSITQGEQVAALWRPLFENFGIRIHFAHRTFRWSNEASGRAAVYCVIVGFGIGSKDKSYLFEYDDVRGEPHKIEAITINPYLVDAPVVFIDKKSQPLSQSAPSMIYGNEPREGGHLLLSDSERRSILSSYPELEKWIKRFVSADDFLNNGIRYCFWLVNAEPKILKIPPVAERLGMVREFRKNLKQKAANEASNTPSLFTSIRQDGRPYLLIPIVSSENRKYIPFGYMDGDVITSNANFILPNASAFHFGILESEMHMTWVRAVCGRLESRYRYSNTIVYNNFSWPENVSEKDKQIVEKAAQNVLDVRNESPNSTLADLYDPNSMPPKLLKAHQELDKAVDKCYGKKGFASEAERLEFLFERYKELVEKESASKKEQSIQGGR